jgi:PGAP2IP, first transmembrane domain
VFALQLAGQPQRSLLPLPVQAMVRTRATSQRSAGEETVRRRVPTAATPATSLAATSDAGPSEEDTADMLTNTMERGRVTDVERKKVADEDGHAPASIGEQPEVSWGVRGMLADLLVGLTFWNVTTMFPDTIFYFPLFKMAISGYELASLLQLIALAVAFSTPRLRSALSTRQPLFHLLSLVGFASFYWLVARMFSSRVACVLRVFTRAR